MKNDFIAVEHYEVINFQHSNQLTLLCYVSLVTVSVILGIVTHA